MEKKLNIADFAALVGTTSKTIYQKINNSSNLPVIEQLKTVKEKVKGRGITLIVTNSQQIEYYKSLYGSEPVNNGVYYETLTDNEGYELVNNVSEPVINGQKPVKYSDNELLGIDAWEKFITVNDKYNERYEQKVTEVITLQNQLAEVKGRQLLLEDKAGREGLYIKEINELKTENNSVKKSLETLKYVIVGLVMVIVGLIMFLTMVNYFNKPVNNVPEPVVNVLQEAQASRGRNGETLSFPVQTRLTRAQQEEAQAVKPTPQLQAQTAKQGKK